MPGLITTSLLNSKMTKNTENYGTLSVAKENEKDDELKEIERSTATSDDDVVGGDESIQIQIEKKPKRIIYCSNGTVEEFDDECTCKPNEKRGETKTDAGPLLLPNHTYLNYVISFTWSLGRKTLKVCDYLGEKLTNVLGITTPKYEFEINEYHRIMDEEKCLKNKHDAQFVGWKNIEDNDHVLTAQNLKTTEHSKAESSAN